MISAFVVSILLISFNFAFARPELLVYHAGSPLAEMPLIVGACEILTSSFPGFSNDLDGCVRYLTDTEFPRTRGFYMEDEQVIGFVSSSFRFDESKETSLMFISEVCVREDRRGHGLASRMLTEFVDDVLKTSLSGLPKGHRTAVGLAINMKSQYAAKNFAMYAKLGFLRWSKNPVDFCMNFHQTEIESVANFSSFWFNRNEMRDALSLEELDSKCVYFHMFKMVVDGVDEENFEAMGRAIQRSIEEKTNGLEDKLKIE